MNYRQMIEDACAYVDRHPDERVTAEILAKRVGYSAYHFARVFFACKGISVVEYARRRRLETAAQSIRSGVSCIDAALSAGYENPSAFSRSFRRAFGASPLSVRKEEFPLHAEIQMTPPILLVGNLTDTPVSGAHSADAPAYWQHIEDEWESELYAAIDPPTHGEYCLCLPSGDGRLRYLCAVRVSSFDGVPEKYARYTVPAGEYAVFTTDPVDQTGGKNDDLFAQKIASLWKAIFEEWFAQSEWQFNPDAPDFEFYDERCHHTSNSVMEIHVPVKKAP